MLFAAHVRGNGARSYCAIRHRQRAAREAQCTQDRSSAPAARSRLRASRDCGPRNTNSPRPPLLCTVLASDGCAGRSGGRWSCCSLELPCRLLGRLPCCGAAQTRQAVLGVWRPASVTVSPDAEAAAGVRSECIGSSAGHRCRAVKCGRCSPLSFTVKHGDAVSGERPCLRGSGERQLPLQTHIWQSQSQRRGRTGGYSPPSYRLLLFHCCWAWMH